MKRLLLILVFLALVAQPCLGTINDFTMSIDNKQTYKNSYRWTGKHKDYLLIWAKEVEDRLDGTLGNQSFYFTPGSAPTATEGRMYYDATGDVIKFRNGSSAWVTLASSSSGTLDEAYDAGGSIDVDATAVTLDNDTGDDNALLILTQDDATNDPNALEITFSSGSIGAGIVIDSQTSGTDIKGDNWSIDQAGKLTILEIAQTGDVLFNGSNYDVAFDASREGIVFEDNAICGFGAGTHNDAADLTISGTGTNVNVEVATEDLADLIFGATNALDILIHNDAADSLITFDCSAEKVELNGWDLRVQDGDFILFGDTSDWTAGSGSAKLLTFTPATGDGSDTLAIGANTAGGDFQLFGANTSGAYCLWDSSNDALWFDQADIALGETDYILFGDTMGTGDLSLGCSADAVLTFGQVVADTGAIFFGVSDDGINTTFYGDSSGGKMVWTEAGLTSGALYFTDAHINLDDESSIYFGSALGTGDFTLTGASNVLTFAQVSQDTGEIVFGVSDHDIPMKWYCETASAFFYFTGDQLQVDGAGGTASIALGDGDAILLGDALGTGCFSIAEATNVLAFTQVAENTGTVTWGADNAGMDVTWYGEDASAYMKWEGEGANNNTLNIVGVDSADTILKLTAVNTTTDADTMTISHGGDGDAIQITVTEPASRGINIIGDAAGTHPQINIDLETGAWVGASATGAIEVTNDGLLVADASLCRLENKGRIAVANSGACLEVIDSGAARTTSYAVRIASTSNEALHIDAGIVQVDETINCTLGCQSDAVDITANTASQAGSLIAAGVRVVIVTGVTVNADDFVVLPAGTLGHRITIIAEAGSNFEIRTVNASNDTINEQDCDSTKEYLVTDGDIVDLICTEASVSWVGISHTILGAAKTVIPD